MLIGKGKIRIVPTTHFSLSPFYSIPYEKGHGYMYSNFLSYAYCVQVAKFGLEHTYTEVTPEILSAQVRIGHFNLGMSSL